MLGLINAIVSSVGAVAGYVKEGLVMANRFLTPPKLSHPAQGSAEFNGSSDYIQLTPSPIGAVSAFTISGWINTTQVFSTSFKGIFSKGVGGYEDIVIFLGAGNKLGLYFVTDLGHSGNNYSTSVVNDGNWHYFSYQWNSTTNTANLYINGSLETTLTRTGSTLNNSFANATIGAYSDIDNYFDGNLANVAIWNRALTSDEINAVMWKGYEALTSGEKNGLQAWYKLQESELFDVSDTSTTNLEKYAKLNSLTFEGKTCLQNALDGFPDITDARMHAGKYDIRVAQDGGNVESLSCVETELNALL